MDSLVVFAIVAVLLFGAIAVVLALVVLRVQSSRTGTEGAHRSIEVRLAELDALVASGTISEREREKARERVLGSL